MDNFVLDLHMKKVHNETQHLLMVRKQNIALKNQALNKKKKENLNHVCTPTCVCTVPPEHKDACTPCNEKFQNYNQLEKHNKTVHEVDIIHESKYACTHCNIKFQNYNQLEKHKKYVHEADLTKMNRTQKLTHKRKNEDETNKVEEIKSMSHDTAPTNNTKKDSVAKDVGNEFFEVEISPKDGLEDEIATITFKGKSKEFESAAKVLKDLLTKPKSSYIVEGREAKIISAPKDSKPITVEVTTIKGDVGRAGLKFYSSKTNTIMVTKQKGQDNIFAKALALKIIKDLLVGLTTGDITEESLKTMYIKYEDNPEGRFKCELCERTFSSKQGKSIHMTKGHTGKIKQRKCEQCGKNFKMEKSMEHHIKICHTREESNETKLGCTICGKMCESVGALKEHITNHEVFDGMIKRTPESKRVKFEEEIVAKGPTKRKMSLENVVKNEMVTRKCDDCDEKFEKMTQIDWIKLVQKHKVTDCTEKKPLKITDKICLESTSPPRKKRNERHYPEMNNDENDQMDIETNKEFEEVLSEEMKNLHVKTNEEQNTKKEEETKVINEKMKKKIDIVLQMKQKKQHTRDEFLKQQQYEKKEMERRSQMMDKKVEETRKRREMEENDRKKKINVEEIIQMKKVEMKAIHEKNERYQRKIMLKKQKKKKIQMEANGYTEIDQKYHKFVGKYKYQSHGLGDGACQSRGESKILFGTQDIGPRYATVKNQYMLDHFKPYFEDVITFPHTIKVGSGIFHTFNTFEQFKLYLQTNPNASLMWADHVQLQITANMYNITTHLLVASNEGNVYTFTPDQRLKEFAELKDVEWKDELWLIYSNGNHYDALVAEDSTCVTMNRKVEEKEDSDSETDETNNTKEKPNQKEKDVKIVESAIETNPHLGKWIAGPPKSNTTNKCEVCNFTFMNYNLLKEHIAESHQQVSEKMPLNQIAEENELAKEKKEHNKTKKAYKDLEIEYINCKNELKKIQEVKERQQIEIKDLNSFHELNEIEKEHINSENSVQIKENVSKQLFICATCEYPFRSKAQVTKHNQNHRKQIVEVQLKQNCAICKETFSSSIELRRHINNKHTNRFNCDQCDFQGSSKMILTKHINLKHRTKCDQEDGPLRCTLCQEQFTSLWNLNTHIRDTHGQQIPCKFFQGGKCRFPEGVCWNKHEKEVIESVPNNESIFTCHVCKKQFSNKNEMMMHKKTNHPDKVKKCQESINCRFKQTCWFTHENSTTKSIAETSTNGESNEEPSTNSESIEESSTNNGSIGKDFQEDQVKAKPPSGI